MEGLFKKAASFLDRSPELWKENIELVELNRRFLWFLILRFGVIFLTFGLGLTRNIFIPHIGIGSIVFFRVSLILLILNIIYWCYYEWTILTKKFPKNVKMVAGNVQVQMILDFLILGYIVYECGGIESPLIYFFLFHNTLSCLFFKKRISLFHTILSVVIILSIFFLTSWGILPEHHFISNLSISTGLFSKPFVYYYLAGVIFIYFTIWYLVSAITESLKRRERELQETIQEMIDLAREKTRYLLVTTHELKAPFAAIQSYVNVALDGYAGEMPEKIKEILWKIKARCNTLANMITEMIQLANITSIKEKKQNIETSRVNISELIVNMLPRFKDPASAKGVSFESKDLEKAFFIEVNVQQAEILFNNIILNSVTYSYPNTKVEITVSESEDAVTICIKDNGIGIKKEHLEKVFLEHFRTERAVEINPNSTGLGLTIAKQIVDIHKGRIRIDSEEGKGTSVFLEFLKAPF